VANVPARHESSTIWRVPAHLLAFVGVAALAITTPGPETALIVRNTIAGGRAAGFASVGGVAVGLALWSLATIVGLTALLLAFAPLYAAIRVAGAAYLVFLGVQALRSAFRGGPRAIAGETSPSRAPRVAFRQGLVSDLGNPKLGAFMTSLLPQFVLPGGSPALQLTLLCVIFSVMTIGWFAFYVEAVSRGAHIFARSRVRRALDGVTGTVLIAFGARLATEH
jgi:threonine/homoserine/homoserine lactone efflux protein